MKTTKATFGMGCFWRPQQLFDRLTGVVETAVGYTGGDTENPTYADVCRGDNAHVEVTEITYDADVLSYEDLLRTFWNNHDPTQINRQGADVGWQYRSVIYYHDAIQRTYAEQSKLTEQNAHAMPIATTIEPAAVFWRAEDYHQHYLNKRASVAP